MSTSHGSKASFFMGSAGSPTVLVDYSTYFNATGLPFQRDKAEVSTFHAIEKAYVAGLIDAAIPLDGPFDPTIDGILFGLLTASTTANFAYYPQGTTTGNVMYTGSLWVTKHEIKTDVNAAGTIGAEGQVSGLVSRGTAP